MCIECKYFVNNNVCSPYLKIESFSNAGEAGGIVTTISLVLTLSGRLTLSLVTKNFEFAKIILICQKLNYLILINQFFSSEIYNFFISTKGNSPLNKMKSMNLLNLLIKPDDSKTLGYKFEFEKVPSTIISNAGGVFICFIAFQIIFIQFTIIFNKIKIIDNWNDGIE